MLLATVQKFASNQPRGTIFVTVINGELLAHFGESPVSIKSLGKDSSVVAKMPGSTRPAHFVLDGRSSVAALVCDEEDNGEITFDRQ